MAKNEDFDGFLSDEGRIIYDALLAHCKLKLKMMNVDCFELAMLANSFHLYADCAKNCNETGIKMTIITESGASYSQIRPEYTVMKNEYANILKHSGKFGLNPGDRMKIFKGIEGKKPKALEAKMRAAS